MQTHTVQNLRKAYDAVIIGGGHNGLVAACYLRKAGLTVAVLERRHVVGGAAVTEEIIPGFKFSRCSYLLSLLRPVVYEDLELKKNGLKLHFRDPYSFTPLKGSTKSLLLGGSHEENFKQIAQFSRKDAAKFVEYEKLLYRMVDAIDPLFDVAPPSLNRHPGTSRLDNWRSWKQVIQTCVGLRGMYGSTYEFLTAPISKVLNHWFESEPLKSTLGTDGLIGSTLGPRDGGTGYVLLHHVMGRLEGRQGAWAYVEGGMGALSEVLAKVLRNSGGNVFTDAAVDKVTVVDGQATGVRLMSGQTVNAKIVLSNATVRETLLNFVPEEMLDSGFRTQVENIDYSSPVVKINVALSRIPDFAKNGNVVQPHHRASVHLNCESMDSLDEAQKDFVAGRVSSNPLIEMVIPSSLDSTLAPPGAHVALLFVQYAPYAVTVKWTDADRTEFANKVFSQIDNYAPGFSASVVGYEVLTPDILEKTFGLTGGNIFHGGLSWDQLFFARPLAGMSGYRTPVKGLYLCGSGCHPGGGVTGGPGRLGAAAALKDIKKSS